MKHFLRHTLEIIIFYQYLICNFLSFIVFQIYSKLYVNIFYYHEHWYFDVIIWQLRLGNSIYHNQISLLIFSQRGVLNEEYIHCSQRTQRVEAITTDWALKMGLNIFWICIIIIRPCIAWQWQGLTWSRFLLKN